VRYEEISEVIIGTAQIGSLYGVWRGQEQVSDKELRKIIETANALGICSFDTSPDYGVAEKRLGSFSGYDFNITTKVILPTEKDELECYDFFAKLRNSLVNLKKDELHTLLIHNAYALRPELIGVAIKKMLRLKASGLVKNIGLSLYDPADLLQLENIHALDVVQIPCNAFDQRLDAPIIATCKTHNIKIMARSIFLQGLLLNCQTGLPDFFHKWRAQIEAWDSWLNKHSFTPLEGAISHIKSIQNLHPLSVVVGFNSVDQFRQFMNVYKGTNKRIRFDKPSNDRELISPYLWPEI
jgi:aryl-alcohol dehydrogenase-like predicted oxidoreductase